VIPELWSLEHILSACHIKVTQAAFALSHYASLEQIFGVSAVSGPRTPFLSLSIEARPVAFVPTDIVKVI